jgi:glycogen debranching enzyme
VLLPGERIVRAEKLALKHEGSLSSSLRALTQLCGATTLREIGTTGPVMASAHLAENAEVAELRRFEVLFGRDSLLTARFVHNLFPGLTNITVRALAQYQGSRWDAVSEEEPGRIPHEVRDPADPIAQRITRSSGWKWPYYGAVDTTPLFVSAIASLARTGWNIEDLKIPLVAAVDWLLRRLKAGEGILVSQPSNPKGIENQVWKDSWDAFSHADGTVASPPIAAIDVQAIAYDACVDGAELLEHLEGVGHRTTMLRRAADVIRSAVLNDFWLADGTSSYPALGVDWSGPGGVRRAIGARGSNMGQLLFSKLLDGVDFANCRESIVTTLFQPDMLCGAGVRTLGSNERRYRPSGYHNGSSWPWDTATFALGLHRHGYHALGWDLMQRVMAVCDAARAFPEFARGDSGRRIRFNDSIVDVIDSAGRRNRIEQPAQQIQAFTVGAVLAIKRCRSMSRHSALPLQASGPREASLESDLLRQMANMVV